MDISKNFGRLLKNYGFFKCFKTSQSLRIYQVTKFDPLFHLSEVFGCQEKASFPSLRHCYHFSGILKTQVFKPFANDATLKTIPNKYNLTRLKVCEKNLFIKKNSRQEPTHNINFKPFVKKSRLIP